MITWWKRRTLRRLEVRHAGLVAEIAARTAIVKALSDADSYVLDPWVKARRTLAEIEERMQQLKS